MTKQNERKSNENWLYPKTLAKINELHFLNLQQVIDFSKRIPLSSLPETGTTKIQIDVLACDPNRKTIVLAECKDFLSLQDASSSAEQLSMKSFMLKNYPPSNSLGEMDLNFNTLNEFQIIQYISLGSHSGENYKNCKCSGLGELARRLDFYTTYLHTIKRDYMGILLFPAEDAEKEPVYRLATPRPWSRI